MFFAIFLNFAGLGLFCWLLYALAVDALAFFAALSVAIAAFNAGAGIVGAGALALIAGVAVPNLLRIGVAVTRSWPIRLAITLIYAIPAGVAGYQLSGAFAGLGGASGPWRRRVHGVSWSAHSRRSGAGAIGSASSRSREMTRHGRRSVPFWRLGELGRILPRRRAIPVRTAERHIFR